MEIVAKTAWGSRKTNVTAKVGALPKVFVHHTAGYYPKTYAEEVQQMKNLQHIAIDINGHQDIEYNWVIGPTGTVFEARGARRMSAATNDQNTVSRSICVMGNYQIQQVTPESVNSVVQMIKHLIDIEDLQVPRGLEIYGHRDNPAHPNATACPGQSLYDQMGYIRNKVIGYERPEGAEMKDRMVRQKGYANILKIGGGESPLALSGEVKTSLEQEFPDVPKIYQDHTVSFFAWCKVAGLNPQDPNSVVPYPNDPGRFE